MQSTLLTIEAALAGGCYDGAMGRDGDDKTVLEQADERRAGLFEALLHEAIRRTAQVGFSSFFATEDAVRRAFSEAVPRDWVDYASRQSTELRSEMIERSAAEFGAWLRTIDLAQVMSKLLAENDFELKISISSERRSTERAPELSLVTRRK
jgi:hypothetical protein